MAESLEDFLGLSKPNNSVEVSGSLTCLECEEVVSDGYILEDQMILIYHCNNGHESKVKM